MTCVRHGVKILTLLYILAHSLTLIRDNDRRRIGGITSRQRTPKNF